MSGDPSTYHGPGVTRPSRDCAHVQSRLLALLDGELSAAQEQAVRQHLGACAACRREWELCRNAEQALASARQNVPPAGDLRSGFYARLAATSSTRRNRSIPLYRLAVPALAACLLATAYFWLDLSPARRNKARVSTPQSPSQQVARSELDAPHPELPALGFTPDLSITPNRHRAGSPHDATAAAPEASALLPRFATPKDFAHTRRWQRPAPMLSERIALALSEEKPALPTSGAASGRAKHSPTDTYYATFGLSMGRKIAGETPLALDKVASPERSFAYADDAERLLAQRYRSAASSQSLGRPMLRDSIKRTEAQLMVAVQRDEDVDVHVTDDVRGFTDSVHIAAASGTQDGAQVVTVDAPDATQEPAQQQSPEKKPRQD